MFVKDLVLCTLHGLKISPNFKFKLMRKLFLFLFLAICMNTVSAQTLTDVAKNEKRIKISGDNILRSHVESKPFSFIFSLATTNDSLNNENNAISVIVDENASTLNKKEYDIIEKIEKAKVTDNGGMHRLTLSVKPNEDNETAKKKIVFNVSIFDKEKKEKYTQVIPATIVNQGDTIGNFRYLAYIGTNFDLVDGVKANNLFFASNIFLPPLGNDRLGFYVSLYGNRTSSFSDSIVGQTRIKEIGFDTAMNSPFTVFERADVVTKSQSDNLGAFFSPLIRLWNQNERFQIYYSPSLEFIWRRSFTELNYVNRVDLERNYTQPPLESYYGPQSFALQPTQTIKGNIYDFNMGILGFFMNHESDKISVRLNMNTGRTSRYISNFNSSRGSLTRDGNVIESNTFSKGGDWFFSGRIWITERYSGITLQAEVTNNLDEPNPYYGVTLSKALDFGKLGGIFKPITK